MRTPVLAPLSAVSATITLVLCSFVIAPSAPAQDSLVPPAAEFASMQPSPEANASFAGYEGALKAAIDANDLKSQALALDRIGVLYFTHRNPVEALKYFQRVLSIVRTLGEQVD